MNMLIENQELLNVSILPGVMPSMREYEIPVATATTVKGDFGVILTQQMTSDHFTILYHVMHIKKNLKFRIIDGNASFIPFLFGLKGTISRQSQEPCLFEGECKPYSVALLLSGKLLMPGEYQLFQINVAREYLTELKRSYSNAINDPFKNEYKNYEHAKSYYATTPLKALLRIRSIVTCKDPGVVGRMQINHNANQLVMHIIEGLTDKKITTLYQSGKDKRVMEEVKAYIINNLGEKITISALGKRFGMADTNLKMNFKTMFHTTIHNFIVRNKMDLAKLLLEEGEDVNQVALKVGYPETTNFIRAFKKKTGITPATYKSGIIRLI